MPRRQEVAIWLFVGAVMGVLTAVAGVVAGLDDQWVQTLTWWALLNGIFAAWATMRIVKSVIRNEQF